MMFNNSPSEFQPSEAYDLSILNQIEDRYKEDIMPLTYRIDVYDDLGIETEDSLFLRDELDRLMVNIKVIIGAGPIISN